jgi:hypothetical protein
MLRMSLLRLPVQTPNCQCALDFAFSAFVMNLGGWIWSYGYVRAEAHFKKPKEIEYYFHLKMPKAFLVKITVNLLLKHRFLQISLTLEFDQNSSLRESLIRL